MVNIQDNTVLDCLIRVTVNHNHNHGNHGRNQTASKKPGKLSEVTLNASHNHNHNRNHNHNHTNFSLRDSLADRVGFWVHHVRFITNLRQLLRQWHWHWHWHSHAMASQLQSRSHLYLQVYSHCWPAATAAWTIANRTPWTRRLTSRW